jgi:hypothetical protein
MAYITCVKEKIKQFCEELEIVLQEHQKENYPNNFMMNPKRVRPEFGRKFARIVLEDNSRSVFCFVDMATGDILKAASWTSLTKGSRGNIGCGNKDNLWNHAVGYYGAAHKR